MDVIGVVVIDGHRGVAVGVLVNGVECDVG